MHDTWEALDLACQVAGRSLGGPEGVALALACMAMAKRERDRIAGTRDGCAAVGSPCVSHPVPPSCGDVLLVIEAAEDPNCRPYWFELE